MFKLKLSKAVFAIVTVLFFVIGFMPELIYPQGKGKGLQEKPQGWEKGEKKGWEDDNPSGLEKSGPSGWEKGEKKGWLSDVPPGLAKKEEGWIPPGWSKGEKDGWKNSFPPGWEKRSKEQQNSWKKNLNSAKDFIKGKGKKRGFSQEEIEQAANALELASRVGVSIEHTKDIVQSAMDKGLRGPAIDKLTRAVSYGVGRDVKFDQLGKFVNEKLDVGLRDEELALEVYKEVQRRHEEKTKVRKAIQEEKERKKKK